MALRLPPADEFRAPFIEPIGHLAMQAARSDQSVVSLLGAVPFDGSPLQMAPVEVDKLVRNWSPKAVKFAEERIALISKPELRQQAAEAIAEYERLKIGRNRVIHDAVEVGLDFDGTVYSLAVQYKPDGVWTHKVSPEQIAALACEVYELNQDLQMIVTMVRDSAPAEIS